MDRITLTGIHAYGTHGLHGSSSPQGRQLFSVDVVMYLDLFDAARSDELVDTVNYDQIASRVASVVEGDHVDLLERLAQKIADAVLLSYRVQKVAVTVHKTAEGTPEALFDDVSVSIERQSQDYNMQAALPAETAESAGKGNAGAAASGAFTAYGNGNRIPDSRLRMMPARPAYRNHLQYIMPLLRWGQTWATANRLCGVQWYRSMPYPGTR